MLGKMKPIWELEIFRNRIRLREPATGRGGEQSATYPFSSASSLVHEPECLEQEIRMLAEAEFGKPGLLGRFPVMRVVHIDAALTEQEVANLRTALADAGASKIFLPEEQ